MALILISADLSPPLHLHIPTDPWTNGSRLADGAYSTPAATPRSSHQIPHGSEASQAGSGMPASAATAVTTSDLSTTDIDGDARLMDTGDQTWGIFLGHRLRNSHSLVDHRPTLASGLLLKRRSTNNDPPPVCMSVSILHAPYAPETVLKEVLITYRELGILARFKGVAHPIDGVLPWHLAAATRAQEVLSALI